ncbi:MAG: sugar phosphate isomerase/epimerase [Bacteroidia bacterium]|nr:sugar phosphate isomerase/epimerase [Bacteroidia bacterium]
MNVLFALMTLWITSSTVTPQQQPPRLLKAEAGLQLYSLRNQLKQDLPGTLAWVKSQGITQVEMAGLYGLTAAQFKAELDKAGLKATSMHAGYDRFTGDIAGVIAEAKALGIKYVGLPWYPHSGDVFTMADAQKAAKDFNAFGKSLADAGLVFFYHNHGYEFQPWENGTLFDYIMTNTDPNLVKIEMDVLWVVFPGQDPAALLRKYPGRYALMHMKDLRQGVKGNLSGHGDDDISVAMGTGQTNWAEVFKAARKGGVTEFFIEDEAAAVQQQIPVSLKFLRGK